MTASPEDTAVTRVRVTALPDTDTDSTPRLPPATLTAKADLSGTSAVSRASLNVMVRVAPSTAADEGAGGTVSWGVAVTSPDGSLSSSPSRALTRTAYSVPSVSPAIVCEVPVTSDSDTSAAVAQSSPDSFHCTVYPVGVGPEAGASQDALSLPLSWRFNVREPGTWTGSELLVTGAAVLLVTACAVKDSASLPSVSLMTLAPLGLA